MTPTFACDISYFQRPVSDAYPHRWLIFRACDGSFRDPNFAANYAWARKAVAKKKLDGFTAYIVYRPGVDTLAVLKAMVGSPHPQLTVMIDVESWSGQIRGDRSSAITKLADGIAAWLGDRRRVLAYANRGDYNALFPHRPSWLRLMLASYGSVQPSMPQMIGWQYSDGDPRWPVPAGHPRSSKPFGRCDHNVFPGLTSGQLAHLLGVADDPVPAVKPKPAPAPPKAKDPDMPAVVSTTVDTPKGQRAQYLLADGQLMQIATPDDSRRLQARYGPATGISEAQFKSWGGRR